jgi:hypothetical protein
LESIRLSPVVVETHGLVALSIVIVQVMLLTVGDPDALMSNVPSSSVVNPALAGLLKAGGPPIVSVNDCVALPLEPLAESVMS